MITVTTLGNVPPFARGLMRDLRVRWALEEAGLAYETRLIDSSIQASPDYRREQIFGQVPVLKDGDLTLFESGAILLHIGGRCEALLPAQAEARARATAWVFAALNTVEVVVQQLAAIDLFYANEAWAQARRPGVEAAVRQRLGQLATWLGDKAHLEDRFTAGDLMMSNVLRNLRQTDLVAGEPNLAAYQQRCEARPAFQRALRDHMAVFEAA